MFRLAVLILLAGSCATTGEAVPVESVAREPAPCEPVPPEQALFVAAVAESLAAGASTTLSELQAEYPDHSLTQSARQVQELTSDRKRASAEVKRLRRQLEEAEADKAGLRQRVEELQQNLDEVERLTIEMEMKAK